jgi:hypothetical protein
MAMAIKDNTWNFAISSLPKKQLAQKSPGITWVKFAANYFGKPERDEVT